MRLGTVEIDGAARVVAALEGEKLLDLGAAALAQGEDARPFADMQRLIEAWDGAREIAERLIASAPDEAVALAGETRFLPPLLPAQYRDCLVFEEHLVNGFRQAGYDDFVIPQVWRDQPIYYKGNRFSFVGHGADVLWPRYSEHLDYELELAIVIGRKGKDIAPEDAPAHIFGYTILNDVSARDAQMREMEGRLGPAKGKDFDSGNILGPFIATADEIPHPAGLRMEARVNGERWGGGHSSAMHHDFAAIIAHVSASETLYPGEVIGSGTVGTGCGLELGKRLYPGDLVELEIEKIGVLANQIVKAV